MIDQKLSHICKLIDSWCNHNHVQYDIVCDESDLQGIMLFNKKPHALHGLINTISPAISENGVHVQSKMVRGGIIMTFSLNAIEESKLKNIIESMGEKELIMSFADKINLAFDQVIVKPQQPATKPVVEPVKYDFASAAADIVKETQHKTASTALYRGTSRDTAINNLVHQSTKGSKKGASKGAAKGATKESVGDFDKSLNEALNGLATSDGQQPDEIFKTFARSLRVLGDRMGIGPLQDRLKQQGISWKQSDDGQSIILSVKNAATGMEQPISSISYETLQNPADFEVQLKNMMDLATGQAPGAFQQQEKEIQDRKKTISDITKAVKPQDQEAEVAQMMNKDIQPEEQAAEVAAMPK